MSVEDYYNRVVGHEWLRESRHRTEFAVTLRALRDHLPPPPAAILDIGGGPGRYAIMLAGLGYRVTLLDLAENNLARAGREATAAGVALVDARRGDARRLVGVGDGEVAAVLLLGPLYHLQQEADRRAAVAEALRVLQPGGALFAAFITRFAQVRYAARFDAEWLARDRLISNSSSRTDATAPNVPVSSPMLTSPIPGKSRHSWRRAAAAHVCCWVLREPSPAWRNGSTHWRGKRGRPGWRSTTGWGTSLRCMAPRTICSMWATGRWLVDRCCQK